MMMNFWSEDVFFILAYSADPVEMPHYTAFHLGLHCLQRVYFYPLQNEKD